ncbi:MAG: tRNA (adenosine(37)-N6)-dimethylallyltransferase MiaA [Actinobacteria bacterium]|uniref:tRNA dimethylallyltransferase n=1 Tax=freshwater metagenome TaxID=449393 RepID=A0A6J6FKH0_9ZZZZ|nr:tRNA (adenosine(37)-N6)-dimethylallyltransferase MiaA [Actinomycetota bacterium]
MPKLIVVTGATATGKSDLAISLAQELGAEIVNADSMQLYRGMDIGTAKLSLAERAGIPHHLLDVVDVDTDVSVSWYQESACAIIDALLAANKSVVVVGGTGLYIKAILDDLNFPETDPAVRAAITTEAEKLGNEAMHKRLSTLDPAAALAIPQENIRRVIRALEVIEITGKPYTANLPREASSKYPHAKQFGLVMDRETLDIRIDARVNQMWQLGFVDEVETLINQGILDGKTARAAIGYAQIIKLKHGEMSEPEAKEDTARATRQYARRQETWFSRDMRIQWIKPGAPEERLSTALSSL